MEEKKHIFTFKTIAIHLLIIAIIELLLTFLIVLIKDNVIIINSSYVVLGALMLFFIIECIYIFVHNFKKYRHKIPLFKDRLKNVEYREELPAPIGTMLSAAFALTHFVVFASFDNKLWYFSILCAVYLLGSSLKMFMSHVDEERGTPIYSRGVKICNALLLALIIAMILTTFLTNYFHHELHEPMYLFILDIIFFFGKLIFAIIGLIGAIEKKAVLMLGHAFAAFALTFYTGYSIIISLVHEHHALSTSNIFIIGLSLFIPLLGLGIFTFIKSFKKS